MNERQSTTLQDDVSPRAGRGRFDAVVETSELICREHYRLRLRIGGGQVFPATRPGQFIQLGCRPPGLPDESGVIARRGGGASSYEGVSCDEATAGASCDGFNVLGREIEWDGEHLPRLTQAELCGNVATLRKPFSLSGRGDDERGTWIEIIHRVVGKGTAWLSGLKPGDAVDLIGPLGNTFTLPAGKRFGLLVGGGVGLPPMFYLAQAMREAGWQAVGFVGALTRDLLAVNFVQDVQADVSGVPARCVREFAACGFDAVITTDDGSAGMKGRITHGVEKLLATLSKEQLSQAVLYTCGPEPMMHAAAKLAAQSGVDCQVCMEQAMACGMGTCQSCIVKMEDQVKPQAVTDDGRGWRYKLACTDGPVFAAEQVVW